MQDRFNFRVWDKENKCMHYPTRHSNFANVNGTIVKIESYPTSNSAYFGKRIAHEFDDAILMQNIGLKDKNRKLIYEGDIVKNDKNLLYSVLFNSFEHQTKICFKRIENPDYYPHISTWQDIGYKDQKNYEVIGNIYENKELLDEIHN